jgi:hypothetical protein
MAEWRANGPEELEGPHRDDVGKWLRLCAGAVSSVKGVVLDETARELLGGDDCVRRLREAGLLEVCREPGGQAVLTAAGSRLLLDLIRLVGVLLLGEQALDSPVYDPDERALRWRGRRVKRLQREAPVQEVVLLAFQRQGWPRRIGDPLPDEPGLDPKERVRETVKGLNRGLKSGTIRFHADGTGRGLLWEAVEEDGPVALGLPPLHP